MAKKDVTGKPKLGSIPYEALVAVANVREYGTKKYGGDANGWMEVESKDFVEAGIRHLYRHLHEDSIDDESGLQHLAHAACSILLAIPQFNNEQWMEESGVGPSLRDYNKHRERWGEYDCNDLENCQWCPHSTWEPNTDVFTKVYRPMPKEIMEALDKNPSMTFAEAQKKADEDLNKRFLDALDTTKHFINMNDGESQ